MYQRRTNKWFIKKKIPPKAWMFVCCECCVLSGRGLCDELITRPEESYRLWCVVVCDLETSRMRRPWPALGRSATAKQKKNWIRSRQAWSVKSTQWEELSTQDLAVRYAVLQYGLPCKKGHLCCAAESIVLFQWDLVLTFPIFYTLLWELYLNVTNCPS